MKSRIAIWAGVGFLIACVWVLLSFMLPPEDLNVVLRRPLVDVLADISCPVIAAAGRYFAIQFWLVPVINGATYALIGTIIEFFRRESNRGFAV